ncbi:uncharacterized protein C05D11.13-like isoform X1 [Ischnura elegans]|uniref:uncharacterized protein C05D11.13-like isoform X1 n=1 Tax=Ischnura elegans TaxID=197161 RepID=UPI001ED89710|nr:uncharacterized protein C05D11.13-like isoform X1 [Ischnura elegans]
MSNYLNVSIPESVQNLHPAYHPGIGELPICVPKPEPPQTSLLVVGAYNNNNVEAPGQTVDQKPSMTARAVETRNRRQFETPEQREARLQRQREANSNRRRRESETEEQRMLRLMANRRRLANESFERRQARLADLSRRQKQRLANETPEQRAARLAYLSRRQKERRANIMATRTRTKYNGGACNTGVQTCCRCECMNKVDNGQSMGRENQE